MTFQKLNRFILFISFLFFVCILTAQNKEYKLVSNQSPTYVEILNFYKVKAAENKNSILLNMGETDGGNSIYIYLINVPNDSVKALNTARNRTTFLINNAIHAGEPDGINACMELVNNLPKNLGISSENERKTPVIAIVLAYNVDGLLNRSSNSRVNQNGPEEYGFRANSSYLDLNREFVKMDSKNAFTFAKIFQSLDPDIFVDTHVSNGADYQYTMTYISPMCERLTPSMDYLQYGLFQPFMDSKFKNAGEKLSPYVNMISDTLSQGIRQFNDQPRYAFGFARVMNCISVTTETHMLKPFDERVNATSLYLKNCVDFCSKYSLQIENARKNAKKFSKIKKIASKYEISKNPTSIIFEGYEAKFKPSEITGESRLYYDKSAPFKKEIPFYNKFQGRDSLVIPVSFVIQKQAFRVIERLKANGIELIEIQKDTSITLLEQRITSFETSKTVYEGHFYHQKVTVERPIKTTTFSKGDFIVNVNQDCWNFVLNTLLPEMEDSYFRWNFFDSYLQQKEGYSDYVFEDLAIEILKENPKIRKEFNDRKMIDKKFGTNPEAQLNFIYERSKYYEDGAFRLPVWEIH